MLRKIKTNLSKDDLQKPAISVDDASKTEGGNGSLTGALLLPENHEISQALAAPVVPKSNDWMLKGDPTAPAIQELEARAAAAREEAMRQAAAQQAMPAPPVGGAMSPMAPVAPVTPTPAQVTDDSTKHFPWAPGSTANKPSRPDDIPTIWDKPLSSELPTAGTAQVTPVAAKPDPELPYQAMPDLTKSAMTTTYTYGVPAPIPTKQPVVTAGGEVIIKIDHNSLPVTSSQTGQMKPEATIVGDGGQADGFASGAAVKIPHDGPLQSLPYSPAAAPKPSSKNVI